MSDGTDHYGKSDRGEEPTAHELLRVAIDQRQRELIAGSWLPQGDFLLNAMQQVYYTVKDERGPHTEVFDLLGNAEAMLSAGTQKFIPPEDGL